MIRLAPSDEERAQRLYRDSVIFVCHDHNLLPRDIEAMRRGGITAKQIHICLDAQLWADREVYEASATREDGYLRRALVALDYLCWQVEHSQNQLVIARTPEDIIEAKERGQVALMLGSEAARLLTLGADSLTLLRIG